jgi:hypothetical protein
LEKEYVRFQGCRSNARDRDKPIGWLATPASVNERWSLATPAGSETPSSKHQTPEKIQASNPKGRRTNFFWLILLPHKCGVPPGYGTPHLCGSEEVCRAPNPKWRRDVAALELGIWSFSGVWSLVFGVCIGHLAPCLPSVSG